MKMSTEENLMKNLTGDPAIVEKLLFSGFDYTLFAFMLGISTAIGIYFGFFGTKQDNVKEYILGGKTMKTFPIAMSLIATDISAMAFIGVPGDIYVYGASYWLNVFPIIFSGIICYYVYLPVFYKFQFTSCFEYLRVRFDERNCMFTSFLIMFAMLLNLPVTIYIPALAFSQVTDVNIHYVTPIVCLVCIFYTTIGGLKAVVWTDTVQFCVMFIAMIFVLVLGFFSTGSITYIFEKSLEGGRLYLWNFDPDPTNRTAIWSPVIGMVFSYTAYIACSQVCNQKFQALPTYGNVKWAMIIYIIGFLFVKSIACVSGLIIYAKYADCDPVATQRVSSSDQLFPYYIMDVAGNIPGLPGMFIAGIFCAALSTMSSDLNTIAGLIYEDFLKSHLPQDTTQQCASNILKIIVVIIGIYCTGMVYIVKHLGTVFPLAISLGDMTAGPLLGVFSLGMLVPVANSKGTLTGAVSALIFMGWIVFGAQYHLSQGGVITPELPTSTDGCAFDYKDLNITVTETSEYSPPWIYRISFYYYSLIGMVVTMVVGVVVSIWTGGRNQKVDRDLLSPVIYFMLPEEQINKHDIALEAINKNYIDDNEMKNDSS